MGKQELTPALLAPLQPVMQEQQALVEELIKLSLLGALFLLP